MSVASSLVAFLFIGLAIAEIAEFFANDESFSGIMMIARPVAVLAMVLLNGNDIWTAVLFAVLWGLLGFWLHMIVSTSKDKKSGNKKKTPAKPKAKPRNDLPFDELPTEDISQLCQPENDAPPVPMDAPPVPMDAPPVTLDAPLQEADSDSL